MTELMRAATSEPPASEPSQTFSLALDSDVSRYEPAPRCRMCDSSMVLYRWQQPHFGEHFWGCGTYPRCRTVMTAIAADDHRSGEPTWT